MVQGERAFGMEKKTTLGNSATEHVGQNGSAVNVSFLTEASSFSITLSL